MVIKIKWKPKKNVKFDGNFKKYISKVRDIQNIDEYLNPSVKNVHNPLLLKDIKMAVERTIQGIDKNEKIIVFADPDVDGVIATVILVDYLKRLSSNVEYRYRERETGHGVKVDDIDKDTDLLIIVDSSSNEYEVVNKLSESMDVIILDHHNVEDSKKINAILVNPNQPDCPYPNKHLSGSGVVWKFIELLDYHYKQINIKRYLDLVAMSLLADQMDMSSLENRWIVKNGLSKIYNIGLLGLIYATKNNGKKLNAQIMNFDIIPLINTVARNNELHKAFKVFFEKDFFKAKRMGEYLIKENKERKIKIKKLFKEYEKIAEVGKFVLVVKEDAEKNYNGLISQQLASKYKRPALVLKNKGNIFAGSGRTFNNFDLQKFLKECPYVSQAEGHSGALGVEIQAENWDKFKQYIEDNIDETLFEEVIEYDIEVSSDELNWDLVKEILEFNHIWGNNAQPIMVKLKNVFINDKELFPKNNPEHVKIIGDNIELLKFNNAKYAADLDSWDIANFVGFLNVNEWRGAKKLQFLIEDYIKQ